MQVPWQVHVLTCHLATLALPEHELRRQDITQHHDECSGQSWGTFPRAVSDLTHWHKYFLYKYGTSSNGFVYRHATSIDVFAYHHRTSTNILCCHGTSINDFLGKSSLQIVPIVITLESCCVCVSVCVTFCINVCSHVAKYSNNVQVYGFLYFQLNDLSPIFIFLDYLFLFFYSFTFSLLVLQRSRKWWEI